MNFRTCTRLGLVFLVLFSALSLSPSPAQAADPADKVIWCPAAVTLPKANKYGCTYAFDNLSLLLAALDDNEPDRAGIFWLGKNYVDTAVGAQVIDGANLTKMAKYPLTIQGGWNGFNTGTLSSTTPSTFDGPSFTVQNWTGNVTIKRILVKNATTPGCSVTAAVCVGTAGNIRLDRVVVLGNLLHGAYLDNRTSTISPPSLVTVTNSRFIGNGFSGLTIYTKGAVKLNNVIADANKSIAGVNVDNTYDTTASPVNITNGQFDGNTSYGSTPTPGMAILSNGTVTITRVQAQYNQGTGLTLDNTSGTGNVLLKETNTFLGNTELGLDILSTGQVTAEHLTAHDNAKYGVRIETQQAVAITGSGKFNGNELGLKIDTVSRITAKNLSAISNATIGLHMATSLAGTDAVILNGVQAHSNAGGLQIYANGKVIVSCGATYSNEVYGLFVSHYLGGSGGAAGLTLQGFRSYLNGTDENLILQTPVVRTPNCP